MAGYAFTTVALAGCLSLVAPDEGPIKTLTYKSNPLGYVATQTLDWKDGGPNTVYKTCVINDKIAGTSLDSNDDGIPESQTVDPTLADICQL